MKYDYELTSSKNGGEIKVDLDCVEMEMLTRAEVLGLYLINEISEKKVKELIEVNEQELEKLAELILRI